MNKPRKRSLCLIPTIGRIAIYNQINKERIGEWTVHILNLPINSFFPTVPTKQCFASSTFSLGPSNITSTHEILLFRQDGNHSNHHFTHVCLSYHHESAKACDIRASSTVHPSQS